MAQEQGSTGSTDTNNTTVDANNAKNTNTDNQNKEKDDITLLKETISTLAEQVKNQSFILGKITNSTKKEVKTETKKDETVDKSDISKFSELEQKIAELQRLNESKTEVAKKSLISKSLIEAGIDPKASGKMGNFLAFELGEKLEASEINGEMRLTVKDGEKEVPLPNYIKMYLESDEGGWMKPSKKGPTPNTGSTQRTGTGSQTVLSPMDYSKAVSQIYADCKREGLGPKDAKARIANLKMGVQ